jgi:hypothetical protein
VAGFSHKLDTLATTLTPDERRLLAEVLILAMTPLERMRFLDFPLDLLTVEEQRLVHTYYGIENT